MELLEIERKKLKLMEEQVALERQKVELQKSMCEALQDIRNEMQNRGQQLPPLRQPIVHDPGSGFSLMQL